MNDPFYDKIVDLVKKESSAIEFHYWFYERNNQSYRAILYQEVFILSIEYICNIHWSYAISVCPEELYDAYRKYLRLKVFK